jgi:hypothetical protein
MTTARIEESNPPPYTPPREPCRQCGRRDSRIMVIFDRDSGAVRGDHYHRHCRACDGRWLEKVRAAMSMKRRHRMAQSAGNMSERTTRCHR